MWTSLSNFFLRMMEVFFRKYLITVRKLWGFLGCTEVPQTLELHSCAWTRHTSGHVVQKEKWNLCEIVVFSFTFRFVHRVENKAQQWKRCTKRKVDFVWDRYIFLSFLLRGDVYMQRKAHMRKSEVLRFAVLRYTLKNVITFEPWLNIFKKKLPSYVKKNLKGRFT